MSFESAQNIVPANESEAKADRVQEIASKAEGMNNHDLKSALEEAWFNVKELGTSGKQGTSEYSDALDKYHGLEQAGKERGIHQG